ncbi:restriction endonuclease subunit S, partial [Methylophaga thiooxydans]|uniref:restriction endonuclease subunit S n=1 Tax=Methylophaga thiooxydans TaxID=392484 RepID=UPI002355BBCA
MALGLSPLEIVNKGKYPLLSKAEHWERVNLSEIADVQNGFAFKSKCFSDTRGIPLVRIRDITKDSTEHNYTGEFSKDYLLKNGDLLVGMDGDFLASKWRGNKALLNQRVCRIKPKSPFYDERFLFLVLQPYLNAVNEETSSVTVKHLSSKTIEDLPLPLPPVFEQRRILAKVEELLSDLDKASESLTLARKQLNVYRQAVLKQAFEGKLTAKWREENADQLESADEISEHIMQEREAQYEERLPYWEQAVQLWKSNGSKGRKPTRLKQKPFAEISSEELGVLPKQPKGHLYTYLSNIGDLGRGKSKHRPRNDPKLFGGQYPFLQTAEVKAADRIIKEYNQTYNDVGLDQSFLWPKGTLCITIAANIAETAFLGFDACFPDSVVGFTASPNLVLPEYVELFIKAIRVRIEEYAPATAQKNINLTTLENLVIPICSLGEQTALVDCVERVLSNITENEKEIERALRQSELLRQSILKKAFSGELVPQ